VSHISISESFSKGGHGWAILHSVLGFLSPTLDDHESIMQGKRDDALSH
jgi:hypothetical protein